MKLLLLQSLLTCHCLAHYIQRYEGDTCSLTSGASGVCLKLSSCTSVLRGIQHGAKPIICEYQNVESVVCCPQVGTTAAPTTPSEDIHVRIRNLTSEAAAAVVKRMCESYGSYGVSSQDPDEVISRASDTSSFFRHTQPGSDDLTRPLSRDMVFRITGGEATEEGEFPHMAALGWGEEDDIQWMCGGSLISERFVLTAGHCMQARSGLVRWVRLGTDVANETTPHTQLIEVKNIHRHENYSMAAYYYDIALLELDREVVMSYFVRPACLHTEFVGPDQGSVTATGWGAVNSTVGESQVLLKVDLEFQRTQVCNTTYATLATTKRLSKGISEDSMICVGNLIEAKDTCQGDSGGPIQVPLSHPPNMYSIVGVTSFGVMGCGVGRSPAIYTRVSHYLPWIADIVWPNL